jgi:hypothetical protein
LLPYTFKEKLLRKSSESKGRSVLIDYILYKVNESREKSAIAVFVETMVSFCAPRLTVLGRRASTLSPDPGNVVPNVPEVSYCCVLT